jgi:hypothetical protein
MDGSELKDEDYKDIKGDTKFGGWFIDPATGQYQIALKVGKVNVNSKGESVGTTRLVKMDAPPDVAAHLISSGQMTRAKQFTAQSLGNLENMPNKTVTIPLGVTPDKGVAKVRKLESSELGDPQYGLGAKYIVEYTINGETRVASYAEPGAITNDISGNIEKFLRELPKK